MLQQLWNGTTLLRKRSPTDHIPAKPFNAHDVEIIVFPLESSKTEMWSTTAYVSHEGEHPVENLDLRDLFPYGGLSVFFLYESPDQETLFHLRIVFSSITSLPPRPINRAIDARFDRLGSVMSSSPSTRNRAPVRNPSFVSIPRPEADIVVALVGDWLEIMWNEMFGSIEGWPEEEREKTYGGLHVRQKRADLPSRNVTGGRSVVADDHVCDIKCFGGFSRRYRTCYAINLAYGRVSRKSTVENNLDDTLLNALKPSGELILVEDARLFSVYIYSPL
ncbi:hypothetical protein DFP72DRAFT_1131046 [Ephemerocybe angulata]|uniref:Uncharacterized protein n=1 Tax=Ephemerocybe angulata TaxID=980116 RepID=A0A8H6HVX0_9AGAR|nr:hypothetical protein DFP72DRAFT_1131046 [Tulosesus angulatus]